MSVTIKNVGNTTVIGIVGKMMLGYGADDFYEAIRNAIDYDKKKIVVDLSNVQFISSWGIGILLHGYTTVNNLEGKFVLAAVPEIVNDALVKTKLDTIFHKCDSVEDALKSQD